MAEHGQLIPHPDAALIRANNARSIARRASVSALASSVSRSGFASLTRRPKRQVTGGRFRAIQSVPEPTRAPSSQIPEDLINQFFAALSFRETQQIVPRQDFQGGHDTSSTGVFGGNIFRFGR